ncbi:O-antigen ligase family protein [bacterium]|nr:O-antigen ligase family protein [bacterium]MBU1599140.1 O-antigen ligase family protein [bacterium]MBU2462149.1 O-antigen ligase family protein [bacterium]
MNKANRVCDFIMLLGLFIYALSATTSISVITIGVVLSSLGWIGKIVLTKRLEIKNTPLNLPILVFLGVITLSAICSFLPIFQGFDGVRSISEKVLLYYLVINGIKEKKHINWLLACIIGSLCLLASYKVGLSIYNPIFQEQMASDRTLGGCLGMVIPLVISMVFLISSWKIRISLILSLITMVICFGLNATRGAWLGSFFAIVFLGLILNRKILLGLGIIVIFFIFFLPRHQIERATNMFSLQFPSNLERIYLWSNAISMIKEHPLLGHGPGSFKVLYMRYVPKVSKELIDTTSLHTQHHRHAHNIFLHIAAETGLLGFLAFFWLLIAAFRLGYGVAQEDERFRILGLGLLASLIDFVVHGMVDYTLAGKSGYLFWFYLGIVAWMKCKSSSLPDINK